MKTSDWIWLGIAGAGIALLLLKKSEAQPPPTTGQEIIVTVLPPIDSPPPPPPPSQPPLTQLEVGLDVNVTDDPSHAGYRQINWSTSIGNPTSSVINGDFIITLNGVVFGHDPYVGIGNLPAYYFSMIAAGRYNTLPRDKPYTICIKPRDPTVAAWMPICKEIVT